MKCFVAIFGLFFLISASADWQLDDQASSVSFVSVKNGAVVEAHEFLNLAGAVGADGKASVTIDLSSVETLIPIRNERMQALLFKGAKSAVVDLELDDAELTQLASGSSQKLTLKANLTLMGMSHTLALPVAVMGADGGVIVSSTKPIVVNAQTLGLEEGVHALRDIAGLQDITLAVPVSFSLKFDAVSD